MGIAALLATDLITDRARHAAGMTHLVVEALAALAALGAAAWVLLALRTKHQEVHRLTGDLAVSREEARRWQREAGALVRGLSHAIDQQFDRWELSPAERKIAEMRTTREATVRQQAQGIHRKGGLLGRAELAAFFLEDLLAPSGPAAPPEG